MSLKGRHLLPPLPLPWLQEPREGQEREGEWEERDLKKSGKDPLEQSKHSSLSPPPTHPCNGS